MLPGLRPALYGVAGVAAFLAIVALLRLADTLLYKLRRALRPAAPGPDPVPLPRELPAEAAARSDGPGPCNPAGAQSEAGHDAVREAACEAVGQHALSSSGTALARRWSDYKGPRRRATDNRPCPVYHGPFRRASDLAAADPVTDILL